MYGVVNLDSVNVEIAADGKRVPVWQQPLESSRQLVVNRLCQRSAVRSVDVKKHEVIGGGRQR